MRLADGVEIMTEQEKQLFLQNEAKERDLHIFIETGSYRGDMIAAMLPLMDRVYSVELHPDRFAECLQRFDYAIRNGSLVIAQGDSAEKLPWFLERVDEPALIWLDAHHSDADSAGSHKTCPLRAELMACLACVVPHVIFVDDARFLGRGNWPTMQEIQVMATGWNVQLADDIVRITR